MTGGVGVFGIHLKITLLIWLAANNRRHDRLANQVQKRGEQENHTYEAAEYGTMLVACQVLAALPDIETVKVTRQTELYHRKRLSSEWTQWLHYERQTRTKRCASDLSGKANLN
jgi:hypothetical protein